MTGSSQRVELITKPGCPLCAQAREVLNQVSEELGIQWVELSCVDHQQLKEKYREEIPVLLVNGKMRDFWVLDENRLRNILLND